MGIKDLIYAFIDTMSYPPELGERRSICKWLLIDKYSVSANQIALNEAVSINKKAFLADLKQIEKGVPLQQVVGFTYFAGCQIKVNADVLIPRPETEELVMLLANRVKRASSILDICTGSGCIAIALKKHFPTSNVSGWDISEAALEVASENAKNNETEVDFKAVNALAIPPSSKVKYDLIVSNPPYIKDVEKREMTKTVLDHEPHIALFVPDEDPLQFYRPIVLFATQNLEKGGTLAFEINKSHGDQISDLLKLQNFSHIEVLKDMSDLPRFVIANR